MFRLKAAKDRNGNFVFQADVRRSCQVIKPDAIPERATIGEA